MAPQGVKQLAMVGVVDHADDRFAVGDDRQRQAPVCRPLRKQLVPSMGSTTHSTRASGRRAPLFAEKTILRKRALNALFDKGLHPLIGHADHILQVVALMVDGQRLALLIVFKRQLSPAFASSQARR